MIKNKKKVVGLWIQQSYIYYIYIIDSGLKKKKKNKSVALCSKKKTRLHHVLLIFSEFCCGFDGLVIFNRYELFLSTKASNLLSHAVVLIFEWFPHGFEGVVLPLFLLEPKKGHRETNKNKHPNVTNYIN